MLQTAALQLTLTLGLASGLTQGPVPGNPGFTQQPLRAPAAQQEEPESEQEARPAFDHSAWTEILSARIQRDRFDYKALAKDTGALRTYLSSLEAVEPAELRRWPKSDQKAFFINAYNAYVVSLIAADYPIKSINDLSTKKVEVWDKRFIPLGSHLATDREKISLNELEHEILRGRYPDARIHVAVNCASESCPPLRAEAFQGPELDEQLDQQARRFIADTARNQLNPSKKRVDASKIFEWFASDFERDAGSTQGWIRRYAPGTTAERAWISKAKLKYREYSWKLNDVKI